MTKPQHQPIGWTNDSDPSGTGYQIMTENGLETYDIDEHAAYLATVERTKQFLARRSMERNHA
jgi:hypothetical protein